MSLLPVASISEQSISLVVSSAKVRISRADQLMPRVTADVPQHWTVLNGVVTQKSPNSTTVIASGAGSVAIGRSCKGSVINTGDGNVNVRQNVTGNGNTVFGAVTGGTFFNSIVGDFSFDETNESEAEDQLELSVPANFSGSLSVVIQGYAEITFDGPWIGDSVSFQFDGGGFVTAPALEVNSLALTSTASARLDVTSVKATNVTLVNSGKSDLWFEELIANTLTVTLSGEGDCSIDSGHADFGSLTSTASGNIFARGKFANLVKTNLGSGIVRVRVPG